MQHEQSMQAHLQMRGINWLYWLSVATRLRRGGLGLMARR